MKSTVLTTIFLVSCIFASSAAVADAPPELTPRQRAELAALRDACTGDYERFCRGIRPGGGRILQCLNVHGGELSPTCGAALTKASALRDTAE